MSTSAEKLPPPSFSLLVTSLGSQAMVALGRFPNPLDGKTEVRLELAAHAIDMLTILEAKTKGNLAADETQLLEGLLYELRMAYVATASAKAKS